jgi:hypothetical protein
LIYDLGWIDQFVINCTVVLNEHVPAESEEFVLK